MIRSIVRGERRERERMIPSSSRLNTTHETSAASAAEVRPHADTSLDVHQRSPLKMI